MKQQTKEQAVVMLAFDAVERYHAGKWDFDDLPPMIDALEVLFAALSKAKQRRLRPAKKDPEKRGRKRTVHEYAIGYLLDRAKREGLRGSKAVEKMHSDLQAEGLQLPATGIDNSTLNRILKRYQRREIRPRLWPRQLR